MKISKLNFLEHFIFKELETRYKVFKKNYDYGILDNHEL